MNDESLLKTVSEYLRDCNSTKFFKTLRNIRDDEYEPLYSSGNVHHFYSFETYLKETYGVELKYDEMGMVIPDYDIIDQKKFLIFCLKH